MSLISPEQVAEFKELGYFVTDPMFTDQDLAAMKAEFKRLYREGIEAAEQQDDVGVMKRACLRPFIGAAHRKSPVLDEFIRKPIYIEACRTFIGDDADLYFNQIVMKAPVAGRFFQWHQDSGYVITEPLEYITCWTAIGRSTTENGCIWVIPKSHEWGLLPHEYSEEDEALRPRFPDGKDDSDAIPVPMDPGQVAIFSSLTLHRSGENSSDEVRYGYVPQYHHPGVVKRDDGAAFGDQTPVLRQGRRVPEPAPEGT